MSPPAGWIAASGRMLASHEPKFARGEMVLFSPGALDGDAPRGSYVVLHSLPDDGIGFQYSIRSAGDAHERIVREHRLKAAGSPPSLLPLRPI